MINCKNKILAFCFLFWTFVSNAQVEQRPFIWVKQEDKALIWSKIETQAWAKSFYREFKERLDSDLVIYKQSPDRFLRGIPFQWDQQKSGKIPPLKTFEESTDTNNNERGLQNKYLQIGIDCGVLYFLTDEPIYAQCAVDILHSYVEGLLQIKPSEEPGNGGWLYPTDHLREARIIGAQLPIIYDFIASYIDKKNKAYSVASKKHVVFSTENAQKVFLTYAKLAIEHGQTGSNWSVLESFSLVNNTLALNDLELRKKYLNYYLVAGTDRQDALTDVSHKYNNEGDVYPETSQYSNGVAEFTTNMLLVLDRYNSDLKLGQKHYKIPFSLDRWNSIRYPNDEIIRFGDGHRNFKVPYDAYDIAYLLGKREGITKLTEKFGPLVAEGIQSKHYKREKVGKRSDGISPYFTPTQLLWLNEIEASSLKKTALPRTDSFPHAGVFLQRNESETKKAEDGLMCFVGGAHMVHGHAGGMDMELYGLGQVLGVDNGRGSYRTDLHENYSRLFAAHNTVIVNGASQGEGGWVNLGMNTTTLDCMEPKPLQKALSPYYSFTRTNFIDDKGEKAEAKQERTLALVRTSETTGYYVDVFRSKSTLPNEYHDYLYHNIGDQLSFLNKDLKLTADENRFQANANVDYKYNRNYKNPGWHFFKNVESSPVYSSDVKASFEISKLKDKKNRQMNLFILGNKDREYSKVRAPHTFEAPKPYDKLPTPTLVIRQKGAAWENPFAVIYEPTFEKDLKNGIQSVSKLESKGVFKGFKVVSLIKNKEITQYIINQDKNTLYENKELGISFQGEFAIISFSKNKKLENIYVGEGLFFKYEKITIDSKNKENWAAFIDFSNNKPQANTSDNALVKIK